MTMTMTLQCKFHFRVVRLNLVLLKTYHQRRCSLRVSISPQVAMRIRCAYMCVHRCEFCVSRAREQNVFVFFLLIVHIIIHTSIARTFVSVKRSTFEFSSLCHLAIGQRSVISFYYICVCPFFLR